MTPRVSIVIPCLNEVRTISYLLEAIRSQTYPLNKMEVVIADGFSTDGTRDEITRYKKEHPEMSIIQVDNPKQIIPAGLNIAIRASRGEIILRMDAHSAPAPDYVELSVRDLKEGKGDNVGGVWQIQPQNDSWIARSIAVAAAHPVGVGDAMYRHASKSAKVDTVPFGAFYRTLMDKLDGYDESLLTNEDYELNARIRKQGGTIWLDSEILSKYTARGDLKFSRETVLSLWILEISNAKTLSRYDSLATISSSGARFIRDNPSHCRDVRTIPSLVAVV